MVDRCPLPPSLLGRRRPEPEELAAGGSIVHRPELPAGHVPDLLAALAG